ncbi:hypothetical protein C7H19_22445 [Aphanothece hegewaldii CCALA 016]|uniref:Uncharacterized protein n=1 Tax=Aphanothece hegewaldii CCALA 016 TaxID=2107694 RepID=A0A2T1LRT3_9CHRO|nr:hypothetical protein [Aphanothece hegewaldii]PSF31700.1 hypothetical protein C7H19_22445 [Aphanothece hegewaldii CCALA 016]
MNIELSDALKLMAQMKDIIPPKMERLSKRFSEIQKASTEVIERTKINKDELVQTLEKAQIIFDELPQILLSSQSQLENHLSTLSNEIKVWEQFFVSNQEELNHEIQQIHHHLQDLKNQIVTQESQHLAMREAFQKALKQLWQTVYQKQELLTVAGETTQQEIYNFQQKIQANHHLLSEQINFLEREIEQNQEEISLTIEDELSSKLSKLRQKLKKDLDKIHDNFDHKSSVLFNDLELNIEENLTHTVEKELDKYLEQIESLEESQQKALEIDLAQDEIENQFNLINGLTPDMIQLIEHINKAKDSLGINF